MDWQTLPREQIELIRKPANARIQVMLSNKALCVSAYGH
jgi:hypothetical protein